MQWERELLQYRTATGTTLPDDVRISIVREASPPELAAHLRVVAGTYVGDYEKFRLIVGEYWAAVMAMGPSASGSGRKSLDFEIGFLQKGKGAGKGSTRTFVGECHRCGGTRGLSAWWL